MKQSIKAAKELHSVNKEFGSESDYKNPYSLKYNLNIPNTVKQSYERKFIMSLLDFGTGQGGLLKTVKEATNEEFKISGFDPAVPEFASLPESPSDLVTCIDVLEHIPREEIDECIRQITQLTSKISFFAIDLIPASKKLADGRNAHLLLAPSDWWAQKLKLHYLSVSFVEVGHLPDGSRYPCHLFCCATNKPHYTQEMNLFMQDIKIIWKKWIWNQSGGTTLVNFE